MLTMGFKDESDPLDVTIVTIADADWPGLATLVAVTVTGFGEGKEAGAV